MRFIQALVLCSVVILAAGCATVSAPKPHGGKPQVSSAGLQACYQITNRMMNFINFASQPSHKDSAASYKMFIGMLTLYDARSNDCKEALQPYPHAVSNYAIATIVEFKAIGFSKDMSFRSWARLSQLIDQKTYLETV